MSSSREFPRPPIVLTLTSSASYYPWNKQLQELATDAGVHLHLGFQPNDRPRMPKLYADTANKISTGQALNERERKEASDHSKSLQIYQKDTALGLKLLKSTVDEEVFQQIKTNIPNRLGLGLGLAMETSRRGAKIVSIQCSWLSNPTKSKPMRRIPRMTTRTWRC